MFLSFSSVLSLLFNLISAKILSTGLTLNEYGTYSAANLVLTTGTSIILCGLVDALNYYFNNKEKNIDESLKAKIVNTVFFIELTLGLILAAVIVIGQNLIADYFSNPGVKVLLYVVSIIPMFQNFIHFMRVLCVATGKAKRMSVYNLSLTVARIIAVYLAVQVLENILWIYVAILVMDLINILFYNLDLRKANVKINPFKISFKHIKPILAYGLPMGIYAITSSFTRDIDKLIIGRLGGPEELAIYTNCSKVLPIDFFVTSFALVLIPYIYRRVSEGRHEESIDLFSSYMKVGYYSVWTLGTMVLVAPASIISFLYSEEYVAGLGVFVLYIFDNMLRFASVHLILTAAGKSKNVMFYSILSLALNFVLNIAFYYMFGMIGPAIATLIVAFIYMFLILRDTTKTIDAKWTEVFDFKDVAVFAVSIGIIWFITFMLNKYLNSLGLHIYFSMFISMAVFGLSVLGLHFGKISRVLKKINSFKL